MWSSCLYMFSPVTTSSFSCTLLMLSFCPFILATKQHKQEITIAKRIYIIVVGVLFHDAKIGLIYEVCKKYRGLFHNSWSVMKYVCSGFVCVYKSDGYKVSVMFLNFVEKRNWLSVLFLMFYFFDAEVESA